MTTVNYEYVLDYLDEHNLLWNGASADLELLASLGFEPITNTVDNWDDDLYFMFTYRYAGIELMIDLFLENTGNDHWSVQAYKGIGSKGHLNIGMDEDGVLIYFKTIEELLQYFMRIANG